MLACGDVVVEKMSHLLVAFVGFGLDLCVLATYFSRVTAIHGSLRRLGHVDFLLGLQLPLVW